LERLVREYLEEKERVFLLEESLETFTTPGPRKRMIPPPQDSTRRKKDKKKSGVKSNEAEGNQKWLGELAPASQR